MARRTGIDALIHVVAEQWCIGYSCDDEVDGGRRPDFRRFIPASGTVSADQFVDWVFRGSGPDPFESEAIERRARTDIRAAFVRHMGGDTVDASALAWTGAYLPLPDPEAFARNLTAEELLRHREEFGPESREGIVAQNELRRRRRPSPLVVHILWATASLLVIAYWLWRWLSA